MGKTRDTGKLATQIQFDNNNNLIIGSSPSSILDISGSIEAGSITGSFTGSVFGLGDVVSFSASINSDLNSIHNTTSSNITKITNLENKTGSLATTGSNTFFGTQTFSGSVYIANDLIVQGSSSIQYITGSSVNIGTNIVQLNTANPSIRFAGLTMIDSGSIGGSGSFLYDSVQDEFIFVHRGNGTNVTSSHFVLGPETYDNLGNESYLTCNRLTKGTGKEHLVDSSIFDNGTTVCINGNTITNNIIVSNNQNTATQVTICNTTCNTSATSELAIGSDVCSGFASIGKYSTGTTAYKTIASKDMYIYNQTGGDISVLNNIASGNIKFTAGGCSSPHLYINCNGNIGVGTNCPANILHIKSSLPRLIVETTDRYAVFNMWAGGSEKGAMYWDNTDLAYKFESNRGYSFYAGGSESLRIENCGQIGFNTDNLTSPGLTGNTLFIRASSSNVGQSAIAIQDYRKCTKWVINGQDGCDNFNFAIYSTPNNTNDYSRRFTINQGGNIGIGVVPCTWRNTFTALQIGTAALTTNSNAYGYFSANFYNDAAGVDRYMTSGKAGVIAISNGEIIFYNTDASCASGCVLGSCERMRITSVGNVGVGLSNPVEGMDVQMALRIRCNTPNFTAACNSLVIDYVNTCIFGSSPTARYYSIGCTGVSAGHQFLVGVPGSGYTALNILGNGTVTRQCQPYFYADTLNGANLAGSQTPVWTNLRASQGSGYNTSNGRFTAPVTGVYSFSWVYLYQSISNYAGCIDDGFSLNGTMIYSGNRYRICQMSWGDGYIAVKGSVVLKLAANDYFSVMTQNSGDASLTGYGGSTWGYLTGALI
jgi:hypothetical protein